MKKNIKAVKKDERHASFISKGVTVFEKKKPQIGVVKRKGKEE